MTHIDEYLYETGNSGANEAINTIYDIMHGNAKITTKVDGAPAIFCGYDPKDKQFFIGTKSVFNKTPKLYKSMADIDANEQGEKAHKLKECLKYLPNIGIPLNTVLQGDLLFTEGDQKFQTIKNKRYITVHPNTLVYGWPANSEMGKKVSNHKMGIAFHTTYTGNDDLQEYRAHFGAMTGNLHSKEVLITDVNVSDKPAFTNEDKQHIIDLCAEASEHIKSFDKIVKAMNLLPKSYIGAGIKTFVNKCVRENFYPTESFGYNQYISFVEDYWTDRVIEKLVTESAKNTKRAALKQLKRELANCREDIEASFAFINKIKEAKDFVLTKLNSNAMQESFVKTDTQIFETPPEGYVAVGETSALKLVDRLAFSRYNFSEEYKKGWQK